MAKKLTLKNYFLLSQDSEQATQRLESLQAWLSKLLLHGTASRARTRFLKLISERAIEIDEERIRLAEDCSKKKKGEIVYKTKDNKETTKKADGVSISIKDFDRFNKEWMKYLKEDFILDVTPETQDTIYGVRDILLETKEEFTGAMALRYDELATAFEEVK